jgi:hypothetical protein
VKEGGGNCFLDLSPESIPGLLKLLQTRARVNIMRLMGLENGRTCSPISKHDICLPFYLSVNLFGAVFVFVASIFFTR